MLDPRSASTLGDCLAIAEVFAGEYPLCLGWQQCLEPLLPPLPERIQVSGQTYERCIAFLVDHELGPHFVFDEAGELADVPLSCVGFAEPLSDAARLWLRAYDAWRRGRLGRQRRPLRLV